MSEAAVFDIPAYTTGSGVTLNLKLAYRTFGQLSAARDNVIVVPTFYGGRDADTAYMHAPGRAIDSSRYFVIVPNMFGNGLSSSPSNTPAPYGRGGTTDFASGMFAIRSTAMVDFCTIAPAALARTTGTMS